MSKSGKVRKKSGRKLEKSGKFRKVAGKIRKVAETSSNIEKLFFYKITKHRKS